MARRIVEGRYAANISGNADGGFLVIVTRDGDCLHGLPSRPYTTEAKAEAGARRMLAKAMA